DDPAVLERRQCGGAGADLLDHGPADEGRAYGSVSERGDVQIHFERFGLTSERVASHQDVEPAEGPLSVDPVDQAIGEHDQAGAGAEHRHADPDRGPDRLRQPELPRELVDHRRLAAGQDQPAHGGELLRTAHSHDVRAEELQQGDVLAHVALESEHPDARALPMRGLLDHCRLRSIGIHNSQTAVRKSSARSMIATMDGPGRRRQGLEGNQSLAVAAQADWSAAGYSPEIRNTTQVPASTSM